MLISKVLQYKLIKKIGNYNFSVDQILKFITLSQLVCTNAYICFVLPTFWTQKYLQVKKYSIQKLFRISNLQLLYIVQFENQGTSTKMLKISKSKA